jgi:hypothetical protein
MSAWVTEHWDELVDAREAGLGSTLSAAEILADRDADRR